MARRKDFQAAITYTGQKIKGAAAISYKIDGVRILYRDGKFVTRNDKVSPGLDIALTDAAKLKIVNHDDCEIFMGNFNDSNSPLQRHEPEPDSIGEDAIYPLDIGTAHAVDPRLFIEVAMDPSPEYIEHELQKAVALGYEGLVIRQQGRWYRVKPFATADVRITGWFEQLDKNKVPKGQLGGFNTNYGKVTAFSDDMRKQLWDDPQQYVGDMMVVRYKELYESGSFRYCVTFLAFRNDKDEEAFDTKYEE